MANKDKNRGQVLKRLIDNEVSNRLQREFNAARYDALTRPSIHSEESMTEQSESIAEREASQHAAYVDAIMNPEGMGMKEHPFLSEFTGSDIVSPEELYEGVTYENSILKSGAQRFTTRFPIGVLPNGETIPTENLTDEEMLALVQSQKGYKLVKDPDSGKELISNDGAVINNWGTTDQVIEFMREVGFKPDLDPGRFRTIGANSDDWNPWGGNMLMAASVPYIDEETGQMRYKRELMTGENMRKMRSGDMAIASALTNPPQDGGFFRSMGGGFTDALTSAPMGAYTSMYAIANLFGADSQKMASKIELDMMQDELDGSDWTTLRSIANPGTFKSGASFGSAVGNVGASLAQYAITGRIVGAALKLGLGTAKGLASATKLSLAEEKLRRRFQTIDKLKKTSKSQNGIINLMEASSVVTPTPEKLAIGEKWLKNMKDLYMSTDGISMVTSGMAMNVSEGYREAISSGVSRDGASQIGVAYGTIATFIETAIGQNFEKWLIGAPEKNALIGNVVRAYKADPSSVTNAKVLKNIADEFVESLSKNPGALRRSAANIVQEGSEEAVQFTAQKIVNGLYEMASGQKYFEEKTNPELFYEAVENFVLGAIGGSISIPGAIYSSRVTPKVNRNFILQQVAAGNSEQMISSIINNTNAEAINKEAAQQMIADIQNWDAVFKADPESFIGLYNIENDDKRNYALGQTIGRIADLQKFIQDGYSRKSIQEDPDSTEQITKPSGFPLRDNYLEVNELANNAITTPIQLSQDPNDNIPVFSSFSALFKKNIDNAYEPHAQLLKSAINSGLRQGGVVEMQLQSLINKYNEGKAESEQISFGDKRVKEAILAARKFGINMATDSAYSQDYLEYYRNKILSNKALQNIDGTPSSLNNEAVLAFNNIIENILNKISITSEKNEFISDDETVMDALYETIVDYNRAWAYSDNAKEDDVIPVEGEPGYINDDSFDLAIKEAENALLPLSKMIGSALGMSKLYETLGLNKNIGFKTDKASSFSEAASNINNTLDLFGRVINNDPSRTYNTSDGSEGGKPLDTTEGQKEAIDKEVSTEKEDDIVFDGDTGRIERNSDNKYTAFGRGADGKLSYHIGDFNTKDEAAEALKLWVDVLNPETSGEGMETPFDEEQREEQNEKTEKEVETPSDSTKDIPEESIVPFDAIDWTSSHIELEPNTIKGIELLEYKGRNKDGKGRGSVLIHNNKEADERILLDYMDFDVIFTDDYTDLIDPIKPKNPNTDPKAPVSRSDLKVDPATLDTWVPSEKIVKTVVGENYQPKGGNTPLTEETNAMLKDFIYFKNEDFLNGTMSLSDTWESVFSDNPNRQAEATNAVNEYTKWTKKGDLSELKKAYETDDSIFMRNWEKMVKALPIQYRFNVNNKSKKILSASDRVIWAHPAIGKTYSLINDSEKFIDWDVEFNKKRNVLIAEKTKTKIDTKEFDNAKKRYLEDSINDKEFVDFMLQEWHRVKEKAKKENKRIFASARNLLILAPNDFDKVITIPKNEFIERSISRGEDEESSKKWKESIDETLKGVDKTKVIETDFYLSEILQDEQGDGIVFLQSEYSDSKVLMTQVELFSKSILVQRMILNGGEIIFNKGEIKREALRFNFKETKKGVKNEPGFFHNLSDPSIPLRLVDTENGYMHETSKGFSPVSFGYVSWDGEIIDNDNSVQPTTANPGQTFMLFKGKASKMGAGYGGAMLLHPRQMNSKEADFIVDLVIGLASGSVNEFSFEEGNRDFGWSDFLNSILSFGPHTAAQTFNGEKIQDKKSHVFYYDDNRVFFGDNGVGGSNNIRVGLSGEVDAADRNALKSWLMSSGDSRYMFYDNNGDLVPNKPFSYGMAKKGAKMPNNILLQGVWDVKPGESIESFIIRNNFFQTNLKPNEPLVKKAFLRFSPEGPIPYRQSKYMSDLKKKVLGTEEKQEVETGVAKEIVDAVLYGAAKNLIPTLEKIKKGDVLSFESTDSNPDVEYVSTLDGMSFDIFQQLFKYQTEKVHGKSIDYDLGVYPNFKIKRNSNALVSEAGVSQTASGTEETGMPEKVIPVYEPKETTEEKATVSSDSKKLDSEPKKKELGREIEYTKEAFDSAVIDMKNDIAESRMVDENGLPNEDAVIAYRYLYGNSVVDQVLKELGESGIAKTESSPEFPFRATKTPVYNQMDYQKESKTLERMLGSKVVRKVTVSNEKIKPTSDSAILVTQSNKPGDWANIYSPLSVLSDGDPIIIHGMLSRSGIVLLDRAEEGTTYHEAFHVVEMLYLNDKQRNRLYDQARKESGRNNITDRQASEMLAEKFRTMVLSRETAEIKHSDNIVIRTLKSMLRFISHWMFNYVPTFSNTQALFDAIYEGHFKYNRATAANIKNLNDLGALYSAVIFEDVEFNTIKSSSVIYGIINNVSDYLISRADNTNFVTHTDMSDYIKNRLKDLVVNGNPYLSLEEEEHAKMVLMELYQKRDWLSKRVKTRLENKYSTEFIEDQDAEDTSLDFVDFAEFSPEAISFYDKIHSVDPTMVDLSKTTSRAVASIINSLRSSSEVNPETGLPVFVQPHIAWATIPNELNGVKDLEDMIDRISKLATDSEYVKRFPDGTVDSVNMFSDLLNRMLNMNENMQKLFLTSIRLYKNKYVTVADTRFGVKRDMMNKPESFRETGFIIDSWKASILEEGAMTSDSVNFATEIVNELEEYIKNEELAGEDIDMQVFSGKLIRAFNSIGINNVTSDSIMRLLDSYAPEIEGVNDAALGILNDKKHGVSQTLNFISKNLLNKNGNLKDKVDIRGKKITKDQFIYKMGMIRPLAKSVASSLGIDKQITIVGADFNRHFVFTKRNALNDMFEIDLRDPKYVKRLLSTKYNRSSRWLKAIDNGAKPNLVTFLQYVDYISPNGVDFNKLTPYQNMLYRLITYANGYIPLPQMGDRKVSYSMEGIGSVSVPLVNKTNTENNDMFISVSDDIVMRFLDYLTSELEAIKQAKLDIVKSIRDAVPNLGDHIDDVNNYESIVKYYNSLTPDDHQAMPPVGLIEKYHYTIMWTNKDGKPAKSDENKVGFKYILGGKGASKLRYFDFMGNTQDVESMSINERMNSIRDFLNKKILDSIILAKESGLIDLNNYSPDSFKQQHINLDIASNNDNASGLNISEINIPEELISRWSNLVDSNIGEGSRMNDEKSLAVVYGLANAAINDIISGMEFERLVMQDISFYKSLDDKNARYQAFQTTGNSLTDSNKTEYKLFNAASIFDSMDQFIDAFRELYIDQFVGLIGDSDPNTTVYTQGMKDKSSESIKNQAIKLAENALSYFKNANKYDGLMMVLPKTYADWYKSLGMWGDQKDIILSQIENEDAIVDDNLLNKLAMQPLKMAVSGVGFTGTLAYPIFYKPSIAPLFWNNIGPNDSARNLKIFLEENGFDGIVFNDTIKLGLQPMANIRNASGGFEFGENVKDNIEAYTATIQARHLRHQIFTEHHVQKDRSIGVQIDRQFVNNLSNSLEVFEMPGGEQIYGKDLFKEWTFIHNELLNIQLNNTIAKFGLSNEEIEDIDVVKKLFQDLIKNQDLSALDQLEIVPKYNSVGEVIGKQFRVNINASTNGTALMNAITGSIGRNILKTNLPGTEMLQEPALGDMTDMHEPYSKAKQLRYRNKNGNMEIAVGVELFKHIIPQFRNMTFGEIKEEILSNPGKYTALLYRIPSQGVNFSAKSEIVDVLPYEFGAICITPTGWTVSSGSDLTNVEVRINFVNCSKSLRAA